ncbi:MAG: hypothetical protein HOP03_09320 [Lysobacter sp.]|nr:hypothetical protein [Lysobacter sp.]
MHRPSPPNLPPPPLPPLPLAVPGHKAIAPWQRRNATYHVVATILHVIGTVFVMQWLADDWKTQWGDQTFVEAAYLSFGGTLIGAFGKWLLMAFLLLLLASGAIQFAIAAAVFRYARQRSALMVFAWLSILSPPLGTFVGLHALRNLKTPNASNDISTGHP